MGDVYKLHYITKINFKFFSFNLKFCATNKKFLSYSIMFNILSLLTNIIELKALVKAWNLIKIGYK